MGIFFKYISRNLTKRPSRGKTVPSPATRVEINIYGLARELLSVAFGPWIWDWWGWAGDWINEIR